MAIKLSKLRANIYQLADQVLRTGVPLEIERKGKKLKLVAEKPKSKLANLKPHRNCILVDPEEIVHMDWSHLWKPDEFI